jgi:membrane-bound lytic murein transglycosylase B
MGSPHCLHEVRRHGRFRRAVLLLLSGLLPLAPLSATFAQGPLVAGQPVEQRYSASIAEASRRLRIPEHWIRAVLAAESDHDTRAVSDAGAMGLMQVMPATWDGLTARLELGDDPFEPHANIIAGTAYLREMLDRYGDVTGMLAAYNAGPSRYDEYLSDGRPLPAETIDYVAKLAPILGGEAQPPGDEPATKLPDWREAPLFVVPAALSPAAGALQPDGQSAAPDNAAPQPRKDPSLPDSDGIFVTTSGGKASP